LNTVDPLAEAYYGFSTYNYVLGNPISLVDPDGTSVSSTGGAITFTGEDAVNAFRQIQSNFNSSPPNEYTAVHKEDGTVEYRQISNEGGDNYDIIHHQYGQVPEKGSSVVTERIDNLNGGARVLPGLFVSYNSVPGTVRATDSPLEWGLEALPKTAVKGSLLILALIKNLGDDAGFKAFKSFSAFKRAKGAAGKGKAWHHIVEQGGNNVSRFGAEAIHNTKNIIRLPHGSGTIHAKVSGFYSSKMPGTNMRVRDYVRKLSYEEQRQFGINVLRKFGYKGLIP